MIANTLLSRVSLCRRARRPLCGGTSVTDTDDAVVMMMFSEPVRSGNTRLCRLQTLLNYFSASRHANKPHMYRVSPERIAHTDASII